MSNFEDDFWNDWTKCPHCKLSDTVRLAASNAWHRQQYKYDALLAQAELLSQALECNNQVLMWNLRNKARSSWKNWYAHNYPTEQK